ncbi:MAG: tRNA (N6-threonylcarbamoyladenosine(37)-N6)-methyltransferase TrmO [Bacteroidales bacterium]|nr:tRNA (N6-threonylcarbamoyladenosine(37)-N6)-methyltransferase TrmO [Bacteroidales bacterium]
MNIEPIARIRSPFGEKFGIPRQSNIIEDITSVVVFEPSFRNPDALRGIDEFDYLWLVWLFSENVEAGWTPTVRPPRLGGNRRMGVFATRSSFRPNSLALSSVRLLSVQLSSPDGPLLHVAGADLLDGTPIYDIKPYLPYTDAHPDARSGFAPSAPKASLTVHCSPSLLSKLPVSSRQSLLDLLSHDPRPSYHHDPERVYGMKFFSFDIRFRVLENNILEVVNIF